MKPHKKKKKKQLRSVFPILYPSKLGTPYGYRPGDTNEFGGKSVSPPAAPSGGGSAPPAGPSEAYRPKPSRARVLHEMRRSMGMVEYFNDGPQVAWGGYSLPSFGSATLIRGGGPTITGPGFPSDIKGRDGKEDTGRYDFQKSPGLGFRTEMAWRIWEKAMQVIDEDPSQPKHAILLRAMAKAGVHRGQMDPAEFRLLEMGIEWYLSDAGALAAKRDVFY